MLFRSVHKPVGMYTPDDFDKVFTTNLKAPFFLAQEFLPLMKHGSHILNIGSMGGVQGSLKFPGLSLYSASKGALSVWTESLAAELSEKGIHVNCIAPGSIDTEMFAEAFPGAAASFTASQAAAFISFFITSGYRYFNGKILPLSVTTP